MLRTITCSLLLAIAAAAQAPAHAVDLFPVSNSYPREIFQHEDRVHFVGQATAGVRYSRSSDGGRTLDVLDVEIATFEHGAAAADGDLIVVAGRFPSPDLALSHDGGDSWTVQPTVLPGAPWTSLHVRGNTITAAALFTDGSVQLRQSPDAGATWGAIQQLRAAANNQYISGPLLRIVDDGPRLHVAWVEQVWPLGMGMLQTSADGGATWLPQARQVTPIFAFLQTLLPGLVANGDTMVIGYPGFGVQRSTDGGLTWSATTCAVESVQSVVNAGPMVVAAGQLAPMPQPTSVVDISFDYGQTWSAQPLLLQTFNGFVAEAHVSATDIYVLFWNFIWVNAETLIRSHDLGGTWTSEPLVDRVSVGPRRVIQTDSDFNPPPEHLAYVALGYTVVDGGATAGTGGLTPELSLVGTTHLGSGTSGIAIDNARGGAIGLLGLSDQEPIATPWLGGTVWLQAPTLVPFVTGGAAGAAGAGSWLEPLPIPNVPALAGEGFTAQAAIVDPAANGGLALSNAIELWLR